jgi:hypothetical protein
MTGMNDEQLDEVIENTFQMEFWRTTGHGLAIASVGVSV